MNGENEQVKAHVTELVELYAMNSVRLLEQIADVFDAAPVRDEFFTGRMVAAVIRDCVEPLREGVRRR